MERKVAEVTGSYRGERNEIRKLQRITDTREEGEKIAR